MLFDKYYSNLPVNSNGNESEYKHFQKFVLDIIPTWGGNPDLLERFWKLIHWNTTFIDFTEIIVNISILEKGELLDQFRCKIIFTYFIFIVRLYETL